MTKENRRANSTIISKIWNLAGVLRAAEKAEYEAFADRDTFRTLEEIGRRVGDKDAESDN